MQAGGVTAAPAPAPPNGYGTQQQQQQQQQMLLQQHHQQQLSNNSPASTAATGTATTNKILINGGRFDFDDGGTYCGGWEDGKAHGHGVCTGPKGQGAYSGSWHYGFEVSGVYMWPSGNTFEGQWQNGKRHGLGVESRGRWLYRGEWTQGFKGRYGVRQSATTNAKYEGTWANGLQDGYGSETYADGGTFQGQWMRGMRHGYGVRTSARFGMASHSKPNKSDIRNSLSSLGSDDAHNKVGSASDDPVIGSEGRDKKLDDTRGGFVLKANSDEQPNKHKTLVSKSTHSLKRTFMSGFKMRKQRSTGELEKKVSGSIRSTASCTSWISTGSSQSAMGESYNTDSNASFIVEDEHMDVNTTETYVGEWKNDKRSGYGIAERTDGLKYEGEWFANKKYGYGVTTFKDGTKEEGKYKNNVLVTSQKKKHYFLMRSAKLKERIEASVNAAHRASKIALQKADIAISRMATARGKAELSDIAADHAREDYEIAKLTAKQFAPDFIQPGLEKTRLREILKQRMSIDQKTILQPLMPMPNPVGPTSPSDAADASSLSLSTNNLLYSTTGGQQDAAETTPQFRPRSHYAQPYYQSTGSNHLQQQQQQQQSGGGVNSQSSAGQSYPRNSLTPEMRQNSSSNHHPQQNHGYNQNSGGSSAPPPPPPSRANNNGLGDQYPGNAQNSMYGAGARRQYGQNGSGGGAAGGSGGGPPTARQSLVDRASFSQQRMSSSSHAPYPRANEDGNGGGGVAGSPRRDSVSRPNRYNQYEVGVDDDTDPSLLRRNTKYVNRESLYSFQQAMSDHFDHYKRPPSRDNSVDRYSRAASRLSGGSRQSSVEKSQNQQQQRRGGDDRLPSSSSSAADKSYSGGAGFNAASAAGAKQNISSSAATQRQVPPFEDIILRQRNLGQEIVPSPIGQPKRTESLYVNPNTARKETKPKVSTTNIRSRSNSLDNGDDQSTHGGSVGSVGSGGSDSSYGSRRGSIIGCCCFICNRNDDNDDHSDIIDSNGCLVMRGNSDCRTNSSSTSDDNGRGSGDGHAVMDSFNFSEIGGSGDGRVSRISGYIHTSRGRGVGRSRSNSTDNYGSRVSGDGLDSMLSADEHANMISGGGRPSRCNGNRGSSRGRGEGRSSSRSADGRATSSTIPMNSHNGHSSGNNASGSSIILPSRSRSRSGLRVRFSDEVSSSDDPPGNHNHIRSNRHSSCDSYFHSRDSNQVTTSASVGTDTREIWNPINLQVGTHGNDGNIGGYGNGDIRRNFDDHSDIVRVHRVGGYESGGVCCSHEDYVSNDIRDVSVVHGRSSIRGNGGGHIPNGIRGVSGVYVSSREVRHHADRHIRGVVIREISNSGHDSGQGTDDYEGDNDFEGFYNYADDYDGEGNYGNRDGGAEGDGRIRRLLPSIPFIQQMECFKSYLRKSHRNILFYHT